MRKKKKLLISFFISFLYVGIGTVVAWVSFPDNQFFGFSYSSDTWYILLILTLPTNLVLFGLYLVDNSIMSTIILQTIILIIWWLIFYWIITLLYPKNLYNIPKKK